MADEPRHELSADTLLRQFGGWKGMLDSSLPTVVFVLVRFVAGIGTSVAAAVVAGVAVVLLRRAQGDTMQHALSGFAGLLITVLIVLITGSGKAIFLMGILLTAGSGVGFLVSLLVGKPAVALGLAAADPKYAVWKTYEPLRRACSLSTIAWCVCFFVRTAVATTVYLAYGDSPGDNLAILVVINAVKWPLIIGSALLTLGLVRRAGLPPEPDEAAA